MCIHSWSETRRFLIGLVVVALCSSPLAASALERDSVDRFFLEYYRVSSRVTRLSEDLQQSNRRTDLRQVFRVLDQVVAARDHLARYDTAHQLSALQTHVHFTDHSRLRMLFYAYEAMAQMLSAQIDYQVTKSEPLRRLAERYRQTWHEADVGARIQSAP
jgi:hypothetical protein